MANTPSTLDRREFIALAGGLAAVLVVGDGAYLAFRGSTAHAQPSPSKPGTLTQPSTPLNAASSSSSAEATAAADPAPEAEPLPRPTPTRPQWRSKTFPGTCAS